MFPSSRVFSLSLAYRDPHVRIVLKKKKAWVSWRAMLEVHACTSPGHCLFPSVQGEALNDLAQPVKVDAFEGVRIKAFLHGFHASQHRMSVPRWLFDRLVLRSNRSTARPLAGWSASSRSPTGRIDILFVLVITEAHLSFSGAGTHSNNTA